MAELKIEELSQARFRALRDRGFRLVLVKIDETPLPDALAHRLYLDMARGLDYVTKQLRQFARDIAPES